MGGALHLGTLESKEHTLQVVHDESYHDHDESYHDHDESYHLFMMKVIMIMVTMKVYILFPQSLGEALEAVEFSPDGTLLAVALSFIKFIIIISIINHIISVFIFIKFITVSNFIIVFFIVVLRWAVMTVCCTCSSLRRKVLTALKHQINDRYQTKKDDK